MVVSNYAHPNSHVSGNLAITMRSNLEIRSRSVITRIGDALSWEATPTTWATFQGYSNYLFYTSKIGKWRNLCPHNLWWAHLPYCRVSDALIDRSPQLGRWDRADVETTISTEPVSEPIVISLQWVGIVRYNYRSLRSLQLAEKTGWSLPLYREIKQDYLTHSILCPWWIGRRYKGREKGNY